MASYRWDGASGRYRDGAGKFLSGAVVRQAVDNVADLSSQRMADLSRRLLDGSLSLSSWQSGMMAEAKSAHVATGVAAHGGRQQMAPADWLVIGRRVKAEYGYLRTFAGQVADGRQPLDGRMIARAQQYGQSARMTFERMKARDDVVRGMQWERNILHGRDHCSLCPKLSARGWVKIGTLPPIGTRPCRVNDRCSIERRRAAPQPSK